MHKQGRVNSIQWTLYSLVDPVAADPVSEGDDDSMYRFITLS
jgi:hypothetical protein